MALVRAQRAAVEPCPHPLGAHAPRGVRPLAAARQRARGAADGRLEVGANTLFEPDVWITIGEQATVRIGEGTFLNIAVMVAATELVEIGSHCMLANGCFVTDANHRFDDPDRPVPGRASLEGTDADRRQRLARRERRRHERRDDRRALRDRRQQRRDAGHPAVLDRGRRAGEGAARRSRSVDMRRPRARLGVGGNRRTRDCSGCPDGPAWGLRHRQPRTAPSGRRATGTSMADFIAAAGPRLLDAAAVGDGAALAATSATGSGGSVGEPAPRTSSRAPRHRRRTSLDSWFPVRARASQAGRRRRPSGGARATRQNGRARFDAAWRSTSSHLETSRSGTSRPEQVTSATAGPRLSGPGHDRQLRRHRQRPAQRLGLARRLDRQHHRGNVVSRTILVVGDDPHRGPGASSRSGYTLSATAATTSRRSPQARRARPKIMEQNFVRRTARPQPGPATASARPRRARHDHRRENEVLDNAGNGINITNGSRSNESRTTRRSATAGRRTAGTAFDLLDGNDELRRERLDRQRVRVRLPGVPGDLSHTRVPT